MLTGQASTMHFASTKSRTLPVPGLYFHYLCASLDVPYTGSVRTFQFYLTHF